MAYAAAQAPFRAEMELCKDLQLNPDQTLSSLSRPNSLPGQPSIPLAKEKVLPFLKAEFTTPTLDQISPHFWLLATADHSHISSLHKQIVRGRKIVISEDPEMHLVWINNRVFIKPLPEYLVSKAFWEHYFTPDAYDNLDPSRLEAYKAALGYLRTWLFLVSYLSDWRIALDSHLVPDNIDFGDFLALLSDLTNITDEQVSPRYRYGELRLARLNFWVKIWLHQPYFRKVAWQYSDYFSMYYAPLLFIFGILSVTLSAFDLGTSNEESWKAMKVAAARPGLYG
ncbi:hypothetical protein QBC42DRAFT_325511 [Cladorrhinum samala]|uniref:Uncharacterized protein n=1 Tax=Cladorrhinum samala TaxID=585594 RepID=A0AAV9HQH0_9PEZI|nr:hypothetical protein QBC42DRAFT_325511 [Cladorrhinum samala]